MSLISPPESLHGATTPRVEVTPAYADTYGSEACELCRRAGQTFDPWQADALDLILAVDDAGRWACCEYVEIVSRQNGKGAILEGRALAGFFLLGEALILWSAHEYKTAMEAFRRVRTLIRALGEAVNDNLVAFDGFNVKISNTNGEEGFERTDTGARIKFVARSKSSARGFSCNLLILDEAFALTDEQKDALMPTMSAIPNPQIIYTSSPPLDSDSGLPLHALRTRAEKIVAGEEDGDGLGYRDWGAAGDLDHLDGIDLDDRRLWADTNPGVGIRLTLRHIGRERRSMAPRGFARERLGIWPPKPVEGGGAIDTAQWAAIQDPGSKRQGDVALGVDIAPNRSYAAIVVYGLRDDELGHGQVIDYRPGTHWTVDRLVQLVDVLDPVAVGMGRGTYESMRTDLAAVDMHVSDDPEKPKRGDLVVIGGSEMAAACGDILEAVRDATLRIVSAVPLDEAVAGAKVRHVGDAMAWARKDVDVELSPLGGLTVARRAYVTRAHLVTNTYDVLDSVL